VLTGASVGRSGTHTTCRICTDNVSGATATITLRTGRCRPTVALHVMCMHMCMCMYRSHRPFRLQLHFILAKLMPMITPAARAPAAMASTPGDGIMDGDLGQEESHAHLGAQRQGHRRRWTALEDRHCSPRYPSSGGSPLGPRSSPGQTGGRWVFAWAGARVLDHAATLARGAAARAVVTLARWPARAPGAGLGGTTATSAAALAGGAATVAVGASTPRSASARHVSRPKRLETSNAPQRCTGSHSRDRGAKSGR
jgi:hypothetical protein